MKGGAPYRYQSINLLSGERKPTIDDDGFVLWESNAILWYVADRFGRGTIVPEDVRERALVDQWMWWQCSDLGPAMGRAWTNRFFSRRGRRELDEAEYHKQVAAAQKPLALLDAHLARHPYVVGERFSIADIALAEFTWLSGQAEMDLSPHAHVCAWLARLAARPAFQKTRPPAL